MLNQYSRRVEKGRTLILVTKGGGSSSWTSSTLAAMVKVGALFLPAVPPCRTSGLRDMPWLLARWLFWYHSVGLHCEQPCQCNAADRNSFETSLDQG